MNRVLVVEDDSLVRGFLCEVLRGGGYETLEAEGGRKAIRLFETDPVELVIMDLCMRDGEGIETMRVLRNRSRDVKILVVSGAFGGTFLPIAAKLGADATLAKPVEPEALIEAVNKLRRTSSDLLK